MDPKNAETFGLALVSAFVWVASADDGVDMSEFQKFQKVIVESPFATQFDLSKMKHWFHDMANVFDTDYANGIKISRERIRAFAGDLIKAEEIHRIVRAAIVADGKLRDVEETVLREIKKELNNLKGEANESTCL